MDKREKKIIVLGAGLVGNLIAIDLSEKFQVTAVDINEKILLKLKTDFNISTVKADLSNPDTIKEMIRDYDLVVGALPGFMGYESVKSVIEGNKNMVDISFFPEDPFRLNDLAIKHNVTVITDCGVSPGMSNLILGYHNTNMDVNSYKCFVGGLPVETEWPYNYKAVFSPIDVIEEYIRPARYIENGYLITREALSDPELIYFKHIGDLEAWNSDGLRSLLKTMKIPNMIEKTLRYPGSIEYLKVLRKSGFFSYEEININGKLIKPIDVTAKLLFPKWELKPGEEDFTIMRLIIEGVKGGKNKKYLYNLYDRYDKKTEAISMARTTGYTCTAAVNFMLDGYFNKKGICPPEYVGDNERAYKYFLKYLKKRDVIYELTEEK